jgi:hypothetical protein
LSILVLLAPMTAAPAQSPAIYALVVGIDAYASQGGQLKDLKGAVNDALDIEAALRQLGAKRVIRLIDGEARRQAIIDSWNTLRAEARPGDTFIFTYSGHGGQEPERIKGSEADGKDEVLLLGRFRNVRPFNAERIIDDELRAWIDELRGINVIVIIDSCHSGTATRSTMNEEPSVRFAGNYGAIVDDPIPLGPAQPESVPGASPQEFFVGAGADDQQIAEFMLDGKMRGVLSHYFARALRGEADADRDGVLTRGELATYLRNNIAVRSQNLQRPQVEFSGAPDQPVFRVAAPQPTTVRAGSLAVALRDAGAAEQASATQLLRNVRIVPDHADALLAWRASTGDVFTATDLVAEKIDNAARMQGVVDRWRAIDVVRQMVERRSMAVSIRDGDRRRIEYEKVCIEVPEATADTPHLTILNLAGDGTVQFLGTEAETRGAVAGCPRGALGPFAVKPPFGADHVIVIGTAGRPPSELRDSLRRLDGKVQSDRLIGLLTALANEQHGRARVGLVGLYTAARR